MGHLLSTGHTQPNAGPHYIRLCKVDSQASLIFILPQHPHKFDSKKYRTSKGIFDPNATFFHISCLEGTDIQTKKNRQGTDSPKQNQKLRSIIMAAVLGVSLGTLRSNDTTATRTSLKK